MLVLKSKKITFSKEALIWIVGLIILFFTYPAGQEHYSLCIYHNLGFESCPGCGIGRSIGSLMHGDFYASWANHKLGIIALPFILVRIIQLSIQSKN